MAEPFRFQKRSDSKDPMDVIRTEIVESGYTQYLEKDALKNERNANLSFLQSIEVVEAERMSDTTARIVYRLPVSHSYLNPAQTLHGGQQAAMFDIFTSWLLVLIRRPGFWSKMGTSRTLNVTYLRPAFEGEMLRLEAEIVHAGKKLALLKAVLMREKDRAIISTCEHHKYNDDPPQKL